MVPAGVHACFGAAFWKLLQPCIVLSRVLLAADGSGYEFLGDMVLKVDKINRQVGLRIWGACCCTL